MRLCILGNSFLGAVKLGWQQSRLASEGGMDASFFGSGGNTLRSLRVVEDALASDDPIVRKMFELTSGGKQEIRLSAFDRFVLVGLSFGLQPVTSIYRTHRLPRHAGQDHRAISEACLEAAVAGVLDDSMAVQAARLIRQAGSSAPIIVLPNPFPRRAILSDEREAELWGDPSITDLLRFFSASVTANASRWGFQVVEQPPETIEAQIFTRHEFSVGAVTPSGRVLPAEDHLHMNAAFGTAFLDALQSRLQ